MDYSSEQIIREKLKNHLQPEEQLVWAGQPDYRVIFGRFGRYEWELISKSICFFLVAVFLEAIAIDDLAEGKPFALIHIAIGAILVLSSIYFLIGRFFYKRWRRKRTYYAISNVRIIEFANIGKGRFDSLPIEEILDIYRSFNKNGLHDVVFANLCYGGYSNFEIIISRLRHRLSRFFAFRDLRDSERAYNLAVREWKKAKRVYPNKERC